MSTTVEPREFPHRWTERVWRQRDPTAVDDLVAEGFVLHSPLQPEPVRGREPVREFVEMVLGAFPDLAAEVADVVAEDDRVACRLEVAGTQEGEFMGVAPTGETMEATVMAFRRIADGRLIEEWQTVDHLAMFRQLGAVELPSGEQSGGAAKGSRGG